MGKLLRTEVHFKVSLPVMLFGFWFVSKILETVRVSQISSGLQGCQEIFHSCVLSNCQHSLLLAAALRTSRGQSWKLLFTPSCVFTRNIYNSCFCQLKQQGMVFLHVVTGCFLSSASLSKDNPLACVLLHLCWGLTMILSCWLSTAFHIWVCSVPGCILYIYIAPSKDLDQLLCMKSAFADPLSTHGSAPSHAYRCLVFWTVDSLAVYHGMKEAISFIRFHFLKKHLNMWKAVFDHC